MKSVWNTVLTLSIFVACLGCTREWEVSPTANERTLLVYLVGDNNLSGEVVQKTQSLLVGWQKAPKGSRMLIFSDVAEGKPPVLMEAVWKHEKATTDTLKQYAEENAASVQLLKEVLTDMRKYAPAKSYGMVLFSHATGWLPAKAFENPLAWKPLPTGRSTRSIFEDRGREMELKDFADAIPDGTFDFMVFDMCFMASVETAYALRQKTVYMVAAAPEILSPGFFPVYEKSLSLLYKKEPDLIGFANAFFTYFDNLQEVYRSAAISVIRTSEMQALAELTRSIHPTRSQQQIDKLQYYDRKGKPHLFFDFADYLFSASANEEQRKQIVALLDKTVIFKKHTEKLINIEILKHSGLSVYIPQDNLPYLNAAYEKTDWYINTK